MQKVTLGSLSQEQRGSLVFPSTPQSKILPPNLARVLACPNSCLGWSLSPCAVWLPSWLSGLCCPPAPQSGAALSRCQACSFLGPRRLCGACRGAEHTVFPGRGGYWVPCWDPESPKGGNTPGRGWKWETDRSRKERITLSLRLVGNGYVYLKVQQGQESQNFHTATCGE